MWGLFLPATYLLTLDKVIGTWQQTAIEQLSKYTIYCWLFPVGRQLNIRASQLQNNPIYVLGIHMKNTSFTDKETRVRSLAAVPSIQCDPKASSTGIQWIQRLHSRLSCSLVCAIISLMHLLLLFSFSHTYSTLCSSHTPTQIPNSIPFSVEPLFPHHSCSQVPWQVSLWQCLGIFWGGLHTDQRKRDMELKRAIRDKTSKERVLCLNLCTFPHSFPLRQHLYCGLCSYTSPHIITVVYIPSLAIIIIAK